MGEQADYIVDKIIFGEIDRWVKDPAIFLKEGVNQLIREMDEIDYWITASGDMIKYNQLTETHARNILASIERQGCIANFRLHDRIKFFDDKNERERLF